MLEHWLEILFSGLGGTVLVAIWIWVARRIARRHRERSQSTAGRSPRAGQTGSLFDDVDDGTSTLPTPEQIIREIAVVSPMGRAATAKRFEGLEINWKLCLEAIYPYDDGVHAALRFSRGENVSFPIINCITRIDAQPQLNVLHERSIFRLKGIVQKANEHEIWIREPNLTLLKGVFHPTKS